MGLPRGSPTHPSSIPHAWIDTHPARGATCAAPLGEARARSPRASQDAAAARLRGLVRQGALREREAARGDLGRWLSARGGVGCCAASSARAGHLSLCTQHTHTHKHHANTGQARRVSPRAAMDRLCRRRRQRARVGLEHAAGAVTARRGGSACVACLAVSLCCPPKKNPQPDKPPHNNTQTQPQLVDAV